MEEEKKEGMEEEKVEEQPTEEEATEEEQPAEEEEKEEEATEEEKPAAEGGKDRFGRTLYKVKCSDCGKEAEVPFKPSGDRPVYCRDCYQKHRERRRF